jgi:site-specific DNA recombinase
MNKSTVIYLRVSTSAQVLNGVSLENQVERCKQYANIRQFSNIVILSDEGISGKSTNRPGFQKLLSMINKNEIENVIVYSLSRFARNIIDTVNTIQLMNKKDVSFHSITESIDTGTAVGRYFLFTLSALAQLEREQISERVSSVLQHKKSLGLRIGQIPFGYKLATDKKNLVQNVKEQETIKLLVDMKEKRGLSYSKIVEELIIAKRKNKNSEIKWHKSQIIKLYKSHAKKNIYF